MQWTDRLITWLVTLLAIRSRIDLLVKPLLFMVLIHATANLAEHLIIGLERFALSERTLLTFVTSLPFLVLVFGVITHLDRMQKQLAELATTDMLTGLNNRRSFLDRTRQAQMRHARGVLFVIDADFFKAINDKYGHAAGDICLQAIARQLRQVLRAQDIIGRVGGEEFAANLPDAPHAEATQIGERLSQAILVEGTDATITLTLSIGATRTHAEGVLEDFLHLADQALYRAKENGRARIVFWEGSDMTAA